MKARWKQSALYNTQPCTPLHFQLIRSAQLQKGERLPRQPHLPSPLSPSVPLSRLLSAEVAWHEVQPLLYWKQCKNMHLHNKARVEPWEQWEKQELARLWTCVQPVKRFSIERIQVEGFGFIRSGTNWIVSPTRVHLWNLLRVVSERVFSHPGAGLWGGLLITRVGAEVRPRTDVREECTE